MIRAILFDMGGTLDGDGLHWLDRFVTLYANAGVALPRETLRAAFDEAERRAAVDDAIATAGLEAMIHRHVHWQLAHLHASPLLARPLVDGFVGPIRAAAAVNVAALSALSDRGFKLGVVSNGCGNVEILCDELGFRRFLSVVVDSRRVGLYKPDPAIFIYAAAKLGEPPASVVMVGDSFDRDIRPARSAGMTTAWLEGPRQRDCPDPAMCDIRLRALADLPAALLAESPVTAR